MKTAKVFKSGNSQAVRLPKDFRIGAKEVAINKIGNVIVLLPKDEPWGLFSEGIKEIGEDFPETIDKVHTLKKVSFK